MTNNLSTLEGAQQEVIDQFEANLHAKGVLDAQFDPSTGLLGLIDRIPDIEPSVNINLDIALTLSSSETSINYGESILLTATLLASYEGVGDVDLKTGEITGATITFKKGQTVIGTSITDNNGVATLTYTPVAADCDTTLTMSAVFSGTDNFNSANSTNVNVTVNSKVELSSNKNILSYADEQTTPGSQVATLTATLYSSTPTGQTVQLCDASDDSVIGNMTDNNDGTYTYSYTSQGSGDIEFYAKTGNLVSETFVVEDCLKTYMQTYLNHYDDTVSTALGYSLPSNWKIECELLFTQSANNSCFIRIGQTDSKALLIGKVGSNDTNYKVYARNGSDVITTGSSITISNDWQPISMSFDGTTFKFNNDMTVTNFNGISLNSLLNVTSWKRSNTSGQIRNIKIKPL